MVCFLETPATKESCQDQEDFAETVSSDCSNATTSCTLRAYEDSLFEVWHRVK